LALEPGRADVCRLGLSGNLLERVKVRPCPDPAKLIPTAAALLDKQLDSRTLGIGVSMTGFLDPIQRKLLFSSATQGGPAADLSPIFHAARHLPMVLENDMHALAARWLLTHCTNQQQDVLLVWIADGRLGAAMLIRGRPNPGCATGANDLGHTRHFVETARCFCGQTGCLERIVSSDFLARQDALRRLSPASASLNERAASFQSVGEDPSLDEVIKYLACSLSNSVNFVRPHRLVLVGELAGFTAFSDALIRLTRAMVLPQLVDRVQFDLWNQPGAGSAETAAWLGMAELLWGGWNQADVTPATRREMSIQIAAPRRSSISEATPEPEPAKAPAIAAPR
jgi:fructokinase